jgi:hypothetical protein
MSRAETGGTLPVASIFQSVALGIRRLGSEGPKNRDATRRNGAHGCDQIAHPPSKQMLYGRVPGSMEFWPSSASCVTSIEAADAQLGGRFPLVDNGDLDRLVVQERLDKALDVESFVLLLVLGERRVQPVHRPLEFRLNRGPALAWAHAVPYAGE